VASPVAADGLMISQSVEAEPVWRARSIPAPKTSTAEDAICPGRPDSSVATRFAPTPLEGGVKLAGVPAVSLRGTAAPDDAAGGTLLPANSTFAQMLFRGS